jgi:hypothetical protein
MYENMFESCLFDACKVKDDKGVMICKAAENLVKECSENYATRFLVVGNIFRLETCMNSLVKVPPYSK